jgi:hypothetical protein
MWSFGFGSNMNVANVEKKKGHKVLASAAGVVHGWKMNFNLRGMAYVEPAFANAMPGNTDENIHGVAILLSAADVTKLTNQERGYQKEWVRVHCYDGRLINAFIFTRTVAGDRPFLLEDEQTPSVRYLNLLINGATSAGLNSAYIERLKTTKTWTPDIALIKKRRNLPNPTDLPVMTVNELFTTRSNSSGENPTCEYAFTAIYGYVLRLPRKKIFFSSHHGRDLTARFSRHFNGISMDNNDDMGKPPFLKLKELASPEAEYIMMWFDYYLAKDPKIVGYIEEFLTQEPSMSTFLSQVCDIAESKLHVHLH